MEHTLNYRFGVVVRAAIALFAPLNLWPQLCQFFLPLRNHVLGV
jgi:hypothetical protein